MATFLLVHGAWHGAWCWRRVVPMLRDAGHEVHAPTLTGLGERAHLARPEIDLETHIADVLGVIEMEELSDVIVCGHSYGGMVVTHVLDRRPDLFTAAVWLDAFIPVDKQSLLDGFPPDRAQHMREQVGTSGDGWRIAPMPPDYFGVMDEADAEWVARRCVDQPYHTFSQRLALGSNWKSVPRKLYILAEYHPNSRFDRFADPLRGDPDWQVVSLPAGHDVMIDTPALLAEQLMSLA